MDGFDVNTEAVVTAGGAVGDTATALAGELARLEDLLGRVQAAWNSTEAAPRFVAAMRSHLDQALLLKEALVGHGAALSTAGRVMAEGEAGLAQTLPGGW